MFQVNIVTRTVIVQRDATTKRFDFGRLIENSAHIKTKQDDGGMVFKSFVSVA